MLADVRGRNNDLSLADIVILNKDDFKEIADVLISIHAFANGSDKTNDCFRLYR